MVVKNGDKPRFSISGTHFLTDENGLSEINAIKAKYIGKRPLSDRRFLAEEVQKALRKLREEGRLFWRDGRAM